MRRLAAVILVYTESQRRELAEVMAAERVVVAPNALYRRWTMRPVFATDVSSVLYVGRLVGSKKPRLLLEAFLIAVRSIKGSPKTVASSSWETVQRPRACGRGLPTYRNTRQAVSSLPAMSHPRGFRSTTERQ